MDSKEISKRINEEISKETKRIEKANFDSTPGFFTQGKEIGETAYLNWRFDKETSFEQFCAMGDAYFEPQYYVLWELLHTNTSQKSDGWMFPVIFNTIHGVECYLKGILGALNIIIQRLEGEQDHNKLKFEFKNTHSINKLCDETIAKMEKINEKDDMDCWLNYIEDMNIVKKFITHIYNNTKDVTSFRYPFSTNFDTFFYNSSSQMEKESTEGDAFKKGTTTDELSENVTLDINIYFSWLTKIHQIFKDMYNALGDILTDYC